jgi:hypothetical protein
MADNALMRCLPLVTIKFILIFAHIWFACTAYLPIPQNTWGTADWQM